MAEEQDEFLNEGDFHEHEGQAEGEKEKDPGKIQLKKGKVFFPQSGRQEDKEETQKESLQKNKGKEKPPFDEDLPFLRRPGEKSLSNG